MRPIRRLHRSLAWRASLLLLLCVVAPLASARAQALRAEVDRRELFENETLTLEVVYEERADTDSIDFEALLPDFTILGIRPSSQTRIVNFHRTSQTSWQLSLMPKDIGTFRIPAFEIGKARTEPIEIRVRAAARSPEQGAPLSAQLEVDRDQAFVGEQILVRITLSAAPGISELRGAPPEIPGAETTLVSQKEFQRIVRSKPFVINELVYAVFPQSPGRLELAPLRYTGALHRTRLVVAKTEPRSIEILDPAEDPEARRKRPWLPASGIALASEWSDKDARKALQLGEPITRTIRIAAAGQRAAAIAPLSFPDSDGAFKQYPEQPVLTDTETSTGILGTRVESIVVVPTEAGELVLPALEIDWWNVDAKRWEVARLPAETLRVEGGPASTGGVARAPTPLPAPTQGSDTTTSGESSGSTGVLSALLIFLALLSTLLGGCSLWLWGRVRRLEAGGARQEASPHAQRTSSRRRADEASAFEQARRSIAARDAAASRRALLAWARARWPKIPITRLDQLLPLLDDATSREILASLDEALYRSDAGADSVDYERLDRLLVSLREKEIEGAHDAPSALPELYPIRP